MSRSCILIAFPLLLVSAQIATAFENQPAPPSAPIMSLSDRVTDLCSRGEYCRFQLTTFV